MPRKEEEVAPGEYLELQRLMHGPPLEELLAVLDAESIPHKVGSTAPVFNLDAIGSERNVEVIVSVPAGLHGKARRALEEIEIRTPLPEDHHLRTATEDDIIEILSQEAEWSPFDVAHARRIAGEMGIDPERLKLEEARATALKREGKQASRWLVLGGFALAIVGACGWLTAGMAGVGIAWSLLSMKNKTPEGAFPTFDESSRKEGKILLWFSLVSILVGVGSRILWFV